MTISLPARRAKALGDGVPVDHLPPRIDIVGPLVLVAQIVRMLPDIDAEDGRLPGHERRVLVGRAGDGQLAAVENQPGPAAAEAPQGRLLDLGLEVVEAAERRIDGLAQSARRRTTAA